MMAGLLNNRKIIVTGGSRGIGRAIVNECIDQGALVGYTRTADHVDEEPWPVIHDDGSIEYICDTTDIMRTHHVIGDLSKRGDVEGIDGIVINAGIYKRSSLRELAKDGWDRTLDVNLNGAFNTIKACMDHMDTGSIVLISSQLAIKGSGQGPDYSASKAGLLGLGRSLARELAPNIRVNCVTPGFVNTDILAGDSEEKRRSRVQQVPLGRIGEPNDIAKPVIFLLSEMSSYVTGATLDVNGGLLIC